MENLKTTSAPAKWVAYYRVSTKRQNLGIDAQRARVYTAAAAAGAVIVAEIEEKESGKECSRPGVNKAIATAKTLHATLVVAKADRLTRDLAFAYRVVFNMGLSFVALNLPPEATKDALLFGVYFGLADQEARMISERTKSALAALKAKGVKLGRPDAATSITDRMREAASATRTRKALENANNVSAANEIRHYLSTGGNKRTLQAIADHLTEGGFYTSRGVFHTPTSVKNLCRLFNIATK